MREAAAVADVRVVRTKNVLRKDSDITGFANGTFLQEFPESLDRN